MGVLLQKHKTFLKTIGSNEHTLMTVLAVLVGVAGGFGAIGFRYLIDFFQWLFYGSSARLLDFIETVPWYWRILAPAMGGLLVGPLVFYLAREAKGHGVPEVMESVVMRSGVIRKRIVLVKSLVSALCIGTGGSAGREGPIVQIGSAIGSTLGQWLKVSQDRIRTLVGCGAAAGIAATFNAPIAGSMFALEIVLGDFGLAIFSPIVISSVTATAVSRHFLGNSPAFIVPAYQLRSAWEFPLYVVLGFVCAAVAVSFTKLLYGTEDFFDRLKFPEVLKATVGGLALGCMAVFFPQILGVGYAGIDLALGLRLAWWLMLLLAFFKILATAITIGSGGSGGIFAPSLFVGAMTGGFFGVAANHVFPDFTASAGAYSIVGMGAVVSATTHGPLSAMLILFEMTGDYKIILPLMITCIISTLLSGQILKESIYTLKLARRGVDIRAGKEVNVLKGMSVWEVMNREVETVPEALGIEALTTKISKSKYNSFPVVDAEGKLTGILSFLDYQDALFDENLKHLVIAKDLATSTVETIASDANLYDALELITRKDFAIMPVVAKEDPTRLLGVLSRRDIIGAYNLAVTKKSLFDK